MYIASKVVYFFFDPDFDPVYASIGYTCSLVVWLRCMHSLGVECRRYDVAHMVGIEQHLLYYM